MITLPDPVTSDKDAMAVYLANCQEAFKAADKAHRAQSTPETRQTLVTAVSSLRQAELNVYGVDCPKCGCSGSHPGVSFQIDCGLCQGEGAVLPHIARRYE